MKLSVPNTTTSRQVPSESHGGSCRDLYQQARNSSKLCDEPSLLLSDANERLEQRDQPLISIPQFEFKSVQQSREFPPRPGAVKKTVSCHSIRDDRDTISSSDVNTLHDNPLSNSMANPPSYFSNSGGARGFLDFIEERQCISNPSSPKDTSTDDLRKSGAKGFLDYIENKYQSPTNLASDFSKSGRANILLNKLTL